MLKWLKSDHRSGRPTHLCYMAIAHRWMDWTPWSPRSRTSSSKAKEYKDPFSPSDGTEQNCSVASCCRPVHTERRLVRTGRKVYDLTRNHGNLQRPRAVHTKQHDATEQFRSIRSPAVAGRCFGVNGSAILGNWRTADLVSFSSSRRVLNISEISSIQLLPVPSRLLVWTIWRLVEFKKTAWWKLVTSRLSSHWKTRRNRTVLFRRLFQCEPC